MRDIEEMLWSMQYDMERREKEYRKANARVQERLNEKLDEYLKNKNSKSAIFTLSELKTIVTSRQKDGESHIEDKALREKYWDFIGNFSLDFDVYFYKDDDDDDVYLGDIYHWFPQAVENYLRERNLL